MARQEAHGKSVMLATKHSASLQLVLCATGLRSFGLQPASVQVISRPARCGDTSETSIRLARARSKLSSGLCWTWRLRRHGRLRRAGCRQPDAARMIPALDIYRRWLSISSTRPSTPRRNRRPPASPARGLSLPSPGGGRLKPVDRSQNPLARLIPRIETCGWPYNGSTPDSALTSCPAGVPTPAGLSCAAQQLARLPLRGRLCLDVGGIRAIPESW